MACKGGDLNGWAANKIQLFFRESCIACCALPCTTNSLVQCSLKSDQWIGSQTYEQMFLHVHITNNSLQRYICIYVYILLGCLMLLLTWDKIELQHCKREGGCIRDGCGGSWVGLGGWGLAYALSMRSVHNSIVKLGSPPSCFSFCFAAKVFDALQSSTTHTEET